MDFAKYGQVYEGDYLIPDGGFDCMREGQKYLVRKDPTEIGHNGLYVECDEGRHYLDGQLCSTTNRYIGFYFGGVSPAVDSQPEMR